MSNVVLGDAVQNLGEYLPNVYVESIEVSSQSLSGGETILFNFNVFYSIIFLISDEYNIEDLQSQLQDLYFLCNFRDDDNVLSKKNFYHN